MKKRAVQIRPAFEKFNSTFQKRMHSNGFTLIELGVVMAIVAVLFAILLPALAGSKVNSQVFQCLENTRRLTLAWRMYAEDNSDLMVYSSDDGNGTAYATTATGSHINNLYAWTWSKMDFNGANGFDWDTNADITLRPLWPYVKVTTAYKCPADASQITISSLPAGYTGTYTNGSVVPRIRSYSMNFYLGGIGGNTAFENDGPAGREENPKDYPWYFKLTDLGNPGKAPGLIQTFVFVEERSDCINWGAYFTDMSGYPVPPSTKPNVALYQFTQDMPASYHNYAGCLSFADGHAEIHRWHDLVVLQPLAPNGTLLNSGRLGGTTFADPYGQDVPYMQNAATRPH